MFCLLGASHPPGPKDLGDVRPRATPKGNLLQIVLFPGLAPWATLFHPFGADEDNKEPIVRCISRKSKSKVEATAAELSRLRPLLEFFAAYRSDLSSRPARFIAAERLLTLRLYTALLSPVKKEVDRRLRMVLGWRGQPRAEVDRSGLRALRRRSRVGRRRQMPLLRSCAKGWELYRYAVIRPSELPSTAVSRGKNFECRLRQKNHDADNSKAEQLLLIGLTLFNRRRCMTRERISGRQGTGRSLIMCR